MQVRGVVEAVPRKQRVALIVGQRGQSVSGFHHFMEGSPFQGLSRAPIFRATLCQSTKTVCEEVDVNAAPCSQLGRNLVCPAIGGGEGDLGNHGDRDGRGCRRARWAGVLGGGLCSCRVDDAEHTPWGDVECQAVFVPAARAVRVDDVEHPPTKTTQHPLFLNDDREPKVEGVSKRDARGFPRQYAASPQTTRAGAWGVGAVCRKKTRTAGGPPLTSLCTMVSKRQQGASSAAAGAREPTPHTHPPAIRQRPMLYWARQMRRRYKRGRTTLTRRDTGHQSSVSAGI